MTAFFTPMRRPRTSITGVMQLVVQLAPRDAVVRESDSRALRVSA